MRSVRLSWIIQKTPKSIGSVSNKYSPSEKSGFCACISSRITTVIHITIDHQINYNCFNEPFAVSPYKSLHWDMHGLIFETSIWLLAGSTRLLPNQHNHQYLQETLTTGWQVKQNPKVGHFQLWLQKESSFQCQAYNCDWEAGLTQVTYKKSSCASKPVPTKAECWDSRAKQKYDQTLETFINSQTSLLNE